MAAVDIPEKVLRELLKKIIELEKAYAHELTGVRNERRNELTKVINKVIAERIEK